LTDTGIEVW